MSMRYDRFIAEVGDRASLSREEAEAATHAVLRVLSERLSGGEAEDLRAQLPKALQEDLLPPEEEAQGFGVTEFARRVAERTGLDESQASIAVAAVLSVLQDAVSGGEFEDVVAQLGRDYAELIDTTT
jgi:uncharacterized protein (DUF2267 family)